VYDDLYDKADKMNLDDLIDQMLDDHMEGDDGSGDGDGDGDQKGKKRPKPMTAEEREQLRQEVKQNILNAARQAEPGSIPVGVKRMIDAITDPKMPWKELLQANLTSTIKNDYSFMRPSRRGWHLDAVLPSQTPGEEVDIVVAIDTSGSISGDQCRNFLGEIQGIMEAFTSYKITVFTFDTDTYNQQEYTSENLENIAEYDVQGGGGTDFDAIFRHLKENDIQPQRLVVFTDGYPFGSWGDADYCDITWIIHGDKNPSPPFGTWAIYDEHN
jgi:predicted metal-dependent peptidase